MKLFVMVAALLTDHHPQISAFQGYIAGPNGRLFLDICASLLK